MKNSPVDMDKEMDKRREAMRKRLEKLGKDNSVVSQAVASNKPRTDSSDWDIVEELVSAARKKYHEGGNLNKCAVDLANAILSVAKKGGLDSKKESVDNNEQSSKEDY